MIIKRNVARLLMAACMAIIPAVGIVGLSPVAHAGGLCGSGVQLGTTTVDGQLFMVCGDAQGTWLVPI